MATMKISKMSASAVMTAKNFKKKSPVWFWVLVAFFTYWGLSTLLFYLKF